MRRIAAVLAVVVGLGLIGFTFVEHLFSRSQDAPKIADHYQPLMSEAGLADLSHGFQAVQDAGGELGTQALPALQRQLGLTDAQFAAYVRAQMPGIANFDAQAPGVVKLVGPVIVQMRAERSDHETASEIPTGFLPLTSAPWLFLGIGVLLVGVGVYARVRPGTLASALLAVVGLGVFLAPLVVGIPGKVDTAVRVTEIGRVGLAPETAQQAVGATRLFDGMVADVTDRLAPALGGEQQFARAFPTLAGFASTRRASTSAKSHALSDSQVEI